MKTYKEIISKCIRKLSRFAWQDVLFDVSRIEWKYGRNENGKPKDYTEWNNIREHLKESGDLLQPQELE